MVENHGFDSETIQYKDMNRGRLGDYRYQFVDTRVTSLTLFGADSVISDEDPLHQIELDLDEPEQSYSTTFNRVLTAAEKQQVVRIMGNNIGDLGRVKAEVFKYKLNLK